MSREDTPHCLRWEIQMHEPFSHVWICKDHGRATIDADPTELGRALLAAYLTDRPTRGETFRTIVHADNDSQTIITPSQLAGAAWKADPAICSALPRYLQEALA